MKKSSKRISGVRELRLLMRQYLLMLLSDKKNLLVSLMFPVIASIITVWIAGENMFVHYDGTKSASFVLVSAAIWGGIFNSIQTIVKDRANIKRDYVSGLRIRCYILSRAIIQFILCIIQSAILCTSYVGVRIFYDNPIPNSGIIFDNVLLEYYVSILLLMYAADAMGLCISCLVKKTETANVMAPYILIVQLIFSGILFEMKGIANWVSYIMVSRWGMEALGTTSNLNSMKLKIQLTVPNVPHEIENMFKYSAKHLYNVWGILIIFIFIFIVLGNILLHRVSKDSR